jgi:hypothetical protein
MTTFFAGELRGLGDVGSRGAFTAGVEFSPPKLTFPGTASNDCRAKLSLRLEVSAVDLQTVVTLVLCSAESLVHPKSRI